MEGIHYPLHPENNVKYIYDSFGRLRLREDGTGSEEFLYDKLGNLAQSLRRIVIPTENNAYMFLTRFTYDSFGRMRSIRYPDGELVKYAYTTGGLLKSVIGQKQNRQHVYLQNRRYDEQGRKTFQLNGNGVCTRYTYDARRQWMKTLQTELPDNNIIQDIQYAYDKVGNIIGIQQLASDVGLGGAYTNTYIYDKQYRLTESNGVGKFPYSFEASYSPSGRLGMKNTSTDQWRSNLLYGYNKSTLPLLTHQPRTVYDSGNGTMNHFWDANGNLAQVVDRNHNAARLHEWDEENRLTFVLGNRYAGYYGYDANGERVYKLVGTTSLNQLNGGYMDANVLFDACVLYPNPYMVVTKSGYTKHYYAGTERLATVIGGGGLGDIGNPINQLSSQHDLDIVSSFHSRYSDSDPFHHANNLSEPVGTVGIDGISHTELEYTCSPIILTDLDVLTHQNILLEAIEQNAPTMTLEQNVYFFHGDHLGSANWITDAGGNPIQYIHYAPYGELIANQQTIGYDERFKFTGKERDAETGYDYFGARFYDYRKGIWNSVDPLADKYPNVTPYLYCNGNPIMLVDPTGEWIAVVSNDDTGTSYKVVGGAVDVGDCSVYVVGNDYDPNSGIKPQGANVLGQTVTPYSFSSYNEETKKDVFAIGSIINMNDKSGDSFIARFQNEEISFIGYIMPPIISNVSGWPNGGCDFKNGDDTNRGMPLSILGGKIGTARDVGNFAAVFFAASLGFTSKTTRKAFDFFQNITTSGCTTGEPPVSWWAQQLGYDYGRAARFANRVCQPNIYNVYR